MTRPKFKVKQKVYGQSDWFVGSYIPEEFVIRKIEVVDGQAKYYVKKRRTAFEEDRFFATVAEAQLNEIKRFIKDVDNTIDELYAKILEYGVDLDEQHLIDIAEHKEGYTIYDKGGMVYGHMDGGAYDFMPESFIVKDKYQINIDNRKMFVYEMKRHGTRPAYENYLYSSFKDALAADILRFKNNTKVRIQILSSKAKLFGIEAEVAKLGLHERFVECGGMMLSASKALKYEQNKHRQNGEGVVFDEANSIKWIREQLSDEPKTYAELYINWKQIVGTSRKYDIIPELEQLLRENFVETNNGKWRNPNNQDCVDKYVSRSNTLLQEFQDYVKQMNDVNGILGDVRVEALRIGIKECYIRKDFKSIIHICDNIPKKLLYDDEVLLQFYDAAQNKIKTTKGK